MDVQPLVFSRLGAGLNVELGAIERLGQHCVAPVDLDQTQQEQRADQSVPADGRKIDSATVSGRSGTPGLGACTSLDFDPGGRTILSKERSMQYTGRATYMLALPVAQLLSIH